MASLLDCRYRVPIDGSPRFYCRHTNVVARGNLVSSAICRSCGVRTKPCADPRPLPTADDLEAALNDRPLPSLLQQAWNVARAVAAFAADGFRTVTCEQYERRLEICDPCEERMGNRCRQCGCHLSLKAKARAFVCPLDKWPDPESSPLEEAS